MDKFSNLFNIIKWQKIIFQKWFNLHLIAKKHLGLGKYRGLWFCDGNGPNSEEMLRRDFNVSNEYLYI